MGGKRKISDRVRSIVTAADLKPTKSAQSRGHAGEQSAGFYFGERGYVFIDGPSGDGGHAANAPGFDGVAYNHDKRHLLIYDNKSFKREGNVSGASAITTHLKDNLAKFVLKVETHPNLKDFEHRALVLDYLKKALASLSNSGRNWPDNVHLVIINSGGRSKGISERLTALNIKWIDYYDAGVVPPDNSAQLVEALGKRPDSSFTKMLKRVLSDGYFSDEDVQMLLESTFDNNGLDEVEAQHLDLVARRSNSMSLENRAVVIDFLRAVRGDGELGGWGDMIQPNDLDIGPLFPSNAYVNFAGTGWRGYFSERPLNLFDFAAKIHDLAYALNAISFTVVKEVLSPWSQSRRAKADFIFRQMTTFTKRMESSKSIHAFRNIAQIAFYGKSEGEFLCKDGFINPLDPRVFAQLCDPRRYLMIPYESLPKEQQYNYFDGTRNGLENQTHKAVDYDDRPGLFHWFLETYRPIKGRIATVTSDSGLKKPSPLVGNRKLRDGADIESITKRRRNRAP